MDEPIPQIDPPEIRRCAVCGEGASKAAALDMRGIEEHN
jgi:hypothetical protein